MISIQQQNPNILAAAHLKASKNDESMNDELGYGETDLLHGLNLSLLCANKGKADELSCLHCQHLVALEEPDPGS